MSRTAALGLVLALLGTALARAATPPPVPLSDEAMAKEREEAFWAMVRNRKGPSEEEIRDTLSRGDFTALEGRLDALQRSHEAGETNEYFVFEAFFIFKKRDLQPEIERWVKEHPHAWSALAARGMMNWALAWRARGGGYISGVTQGQIDQMRAYLNLASGDLHAAIAKRPGFLPAYSGLIDVARMLGDSAAGRDAIEAALRQNPNTYQVRWDYMGALEPKWGGSVAAMDAFAREAQAQAVVNPQLIALLGSPWAARGEDRYLAKDWQAAIDSYSRALQFGRKATWLRWRAGAYKKVNKLPEAIADLSEVLHYTPDSADVLAERASCLQQTQQGDAALHDLARAAELAPDASWIARNYAKALLMSLKPQDSAAVLERFLAAHPRDANTLEDLGLLYRQTLHQPVRARELMERLIEVEPKRAAAWRIYADALFELHDPRARDTYAHYFELVDPKDPVESMMATLIRQRLSNTPPAAMPQ
ncbi:MAG TPA: hypothetical protein VKM54_20995 [Myxococcota bacterium]|nr:hypothetical protein [Myxococcota bacterium]